MDNQTPNTISNSNTIEYIYDIFISYSFSDSKKVSAICRYLEGKGLKCFMAERNMPKGGSFSGIIPWAVEHSRMVLAVLSPHFDASAHTGREIVIASEVGASILTVRLDRCKLTGEKLYYLSNINWVDARENLENALPEIFSSCKVVLEQQPPRKMQEDEFVKPLGKKSPISAQSSLIILVVVIFGVLLYFITQGRTSPINNPIQAKIVDVPAIVYARESIVESEAKESEEKIEKKHVQSKKAAKENAVNREIKQLTKRLTDLQGMGSSKMSEIDGLMLDVISLSTSAEKVADKMKTLALAIDNLPHTKDYLKEGTKKQLFSATATVKSDQAIEKEYEYRNKINFYMGILYYYGIGTDSREPDYETALIYFGKSGIGISEFYQALCMIEVDKDMYKNKILPILSEKKAATSREIYNTYHHESMKEDADYYYGRITNPDGQRFDKEKEQFYLTDTRSHSITYLTNKMKEYRSLTNSNKQQKLWYKEADVILFIEAAQKLKTSDGVFAMNELGYCYFYGRGVKEDKDIGKKWFEKAKKSVADFPEEEDLKNRIDQNLAELAKAKM